MAEERTAPAADDRTDTALKAIHDELTAFRLDAHGRLSRLEIGFDQVDKRIGETNAVVGDTRKEVRQLLYVVLGTWVTTMLAIISMSLTILSRLR
jgi:hypothetical protein